MMVQTQLRIMQRVTCELEMQPHYEKSRIQLKTKGLKQNKPAASSTNLKKNEILPLILRGQMRYEEDWNAIMFLCNPL